MSKSILILDTPANCINCPLASAAREKHSGQMCWKCAIHPTIMIENGKIKPEWCPLKPIPEKQTHYNTDTPHHRYAKDGWNACLNELTKAN